ncbi:MAG: hypothetical protein FWE84_01310 [Firmicutes bacterium]|nr:hypothetical protein [Bacillota bacterium]
MTIEHIPPYVRGEPREYMTVKEFLERYAKCELSNTGNNYTRDIKTFWFELHSVDERKQAHKQKEKVRYNLDVVFFGTENMECSKALRELHGAVEIRLEDESAGFVKMVYKKKDEVLAELSFNAEKVGLKKNKVTIEYKDQPKICDLCGKNILVHPSREFGEECEFCGWYQDEWDVKNPDEVSYYGNLVSLNRARQLLSEGKRIHPTFKGFLDGLDRTLHMEFWYKSKGYGVLAGHGHGFELFEFNKKEGYQSYPTIKEFEEKANIGGVLLKNIWDKVEKAGQMRR